jgi:PAS domain S-box-containing protein
MSKKAKKSPSKTSQSPSPSDLILKNIDEVIYYVLLSGNRREISFISDKTSELLGISKQKYLGLGKDIMHYCHPDDRQEVTKKIAQILKKKIKNSFRYRFYNPKKKKYLWIEETIYPQLDNKKKLEGYFGIARNIDEEKKFEEQTRENERKFSMLAETSTDIIIHYEFGPKPGYTYVSPSVKKILGYDPKDFYKDPMMGYKIIHPTDTKELLAPDKKIRKSKMLRDSFEKLTLRYIAKNGKVVWLENRYSPVREGKEVTSVYCVCRDITDQKQKEEELNASQTQLSNLLSNLPGVAYRCLNDKNWTMKFISSGSHELTGYKPEDFIDNKKRAFASIIHPDDRIIGKQEIEKALKKRSSFEIEHRIIHKNGTVKWIWEKGEGVYDEKGKLLFIDGLINDISARKQAESELNQEWINYRNLIESLPSGIFIHVNGRILFGNKAAYEISEIDPKKEPDKFSLLDFLKPEDRPAAMERIRKSMEGQTLPYIDYSVTGAKGTTKEVRVKAMPITYNSIPAVQIIIQDVTLEKKLEEERIKTKLAEQTNKELQREINLRIESEEKLKAIFESTSHLIWTQNRNREVVSFNHQYFDSVKKICGIEISKGMNLSVLAWAFSEEDQAKIKEAHEGAFNGQDKKFEIALHGIDGKTYYREMHFYPISINGEINEIAAVAQDTTARRNYEKQITDQAKKLRAIIDSGNQHIWTIDRNFRLTSYNKHYEIGHVYSAGVKPELDKSVLDTVKGTPYYEIWKSRYEEALTGKSVQFEVNQEMPDGETRSGLVFLHPILDEKGAVTELAASAQDITLRKEHEKQIIEQTARLHAIFESGSQLMWTLNRNMRLTSFNKNYSNAIYEMYGVYPELNSTPGRHEDEDDSEYNRFWDGKYERVFAGETVEFYTDRTTKSGKKIHRYIFLHPIYNEKNEVVEVSGMGYDMSAQKIAEEEIHNRQSRLSAIINNTSDIILSIDENYNIIEFNEVLKRMVKRAFDVDLKEGMPVFVTIDPRHHEEMRKIYEKVFRGESTSSVGQFGSGSNVIVYETHYNPIRTGNKITGIAIFSRDITEQKRAEEAILNTIREKDVLLKEVHHRVKNNLQVISSILNLQTAYLKDKATINILKECQNRIKTMAFIHESLYQNKDFSQINFSEYIVTLVKNLFYSFETNRQRIRANFDVDTIFLNLDISIPCGLIVNELVSNALKYAFTGREEGAISVQLKHVKDRIKMVIADNGIGMPESVNYKNTETLGLQLVNTLAEQINGTISMERNKGTIFEIIF